MRQSGERETERIFYEWHSAAAVRRSFSSLSAIAAALQQSSNTHTCIPDRRRRHGHWHHPTQPAGHLYLLFWHPQGTIGRLFKLRPSMIGSSGGLQRGVKAGPNSCVVNGEA